MHNSDEAIHRSKRIASNTIILFVRMFILTIINLYAVRLVLIGLGREDYGIFNAVAGVISLLSFLTTVMAVSSQRFLSLSLGKNNNSLFTKLFSASINISVAGTIVAVILFETIGLWFLYNKMIIPVERFHAASMVFQFSIGSLVFTLMQIPFLSAIITYEKMGVYALVSTIDALLRLLCAVLTLTKGSDHLIIYGAGLFITSVITTTLYVAYTLKRFPLCRYTHVGSIRLHRYMLSFSGWTLLGSVSGTCMIQGNMVLLNIFFGPLINAAYGIALQVNNAFATLANNAVTALRPPMLKAFGKHQYDYVGSLFYACNKFLVYILLAVAIPFITETDTIIRFWLGSQDPVTIAFCRWIVVYAILLALNNPITIIIQATGHVKEYHLPVESITLMCIPISWLLFRYGFPAVYVFAVMIGVCLAAHIVRLICLNRFFKHVSVGDYLLSIIVPATAIAAIGGAAGWLLRSHVENVPLRISLSLIALPLLTLTMALIIGITSKERKTLLEYAKNSKYLRQ